MSVLGEDGYPYGVPMNFYYEEAKHVLYFHSAKEGHKCDALAQCAKVSFSFYTETAPKADDWAAQLQSVIVFGQMERLCDPDEMRSALCQLGKKYYPKAEMIDAAMEKSFQHVAVFALHIEQMTGKQIREA